MNSFDHIHLFKTNICTEKDKRRIRLLLDNREEVEEWNIDLEDEDCVLRIVSYTLKKKAIITWVTDRGYLCNELL
jgi:tmRNA-binding protein